MSLLSHAEDGLQDGTVGAFPFQFGFLLTTVSVHSFIIYGLTAISGRSPIVLMCNRHSCFQYHFWWSNSLFLSMFLHVQIYLAELY